MNHLLTGSLSIIIYLASTFFIIKELRLQQAHKVSIYLAWLAAITHTFYNATIFFQPGGINFSFFNTASLITLIIVLILLFAALSKPVEKLGIAVFPIASLMIGMSLLVPVKAQLLQTRGVPMEIHIMSSIVAFSLLNIAAFQAILLAIQDSKLKNHQTNLLIQSLPPLQTMESLLFQMIGMGLVFLSTSLLSGFFFIEDLFAQHLAHKTVLSIFAWIIFSGLLIGRHYYGWRGKPAIRWTLIGFVLLLLAYFGSKLVLELILNRT